jgi:hypothetical protein
MLALKVLLAVFDFLYAHSNRAGAFADDDRERARDENPHAATNPER